MNTKERNFFLTLLLVLSSIPFLHTLNFQFLEGWDDHIYILQNTERLSLNLGNIFHWFKTPCEGCYLPLTMLSYMFDFSLSGLNPLTYRIHNLFWHLAAVCAFFQLLMIFTSNPRLAFLCSLFFAVHPQRVESVVWLSQRKDVLCASFYLWSLFFFLKSEEDKNNRILFYFLSIILAIFALLSKAMAVSLPFVIFIFCIIRTERLEKRLVYKVIPLFLIALIFIPIAIVFQDIPQAHISLPRRTLVVLFNIPWYFTKTLLPFDLSPIYPRIIPSFAKIAGTIIFYIFSIPTIIILLRKNREKFNPINLFFPLCFLISLAPVSGFVPLGAIDYADRYSYIPSVFLILFFSVFALRFFKDIKTEKIFSAALSAYILILASITYFYSFSWVSYRAVLETSVSHNPPPYIALGALADLEYFTGDPSRIPQLAKIAKARERGWESERGVKRLFFKLDLLQMQVYYENGRQEEASKIARQLKNQDVSAFIEDPSELDNLKNFLERILRNNDNDKDNR